MAEIGIAVERQRLPHVAGEPAVLADPDAKVRVVSDEARRFGIIPGTAVLSARALCPDVVCLPYDRSSYEIAARSVWDLLAIESDTIEPAGAETVYAVFRGSIETAAARLQTLLGQIAPRVGVTARAGIARSKFTARVAADQTNLGEAPTCVPAGMDSEILANLPIRLIASIPPKAVNQLARVGVQRLGDLARLQAHQLPKALQKEGHRLLQLAKGFDSDPVRGKWPPRSTDAVTKIEEGVSDMATVEREVASLAERVGRSLSAGPEFCREIAIELGFEDGTTVSQRVRLPFPEGRSGPIARAALRALSSLTVEQPITLIRLTAGDLGAGGGVQLSLPNPDGEEAAERIKRLESVIETLRKAFGPSVIITGALLKQARKIDLWATATTLRLSDPVSQVSLDVEGRPTRFWMAMDTPKRRRGRLQRGGRYDVQRIHDSWTERAYESGVLVDRDVWRLETRPDGLADLQRMRLEWRVAGLWD